MASKQPFAPALAAFTDEERRNAGLEPTPEELSAYLEGELSPAAEEDLQDRLSLQPRATQLLLDLADPSRLIAENADAPGWDELRERLDADGLLDRPASVAVHPSWRRGGVHRAWRWAAAALFVLSSGLVFHALRVGTTVPSPRPATDVVHHVLEPVAAGASRATAPGERIAANEASWQTLVLLLGDTGGFPRHRLLIVRGDAETVWSGEARPTPIGTFDVLVPSSFLAAGHYEIRLVGVDGERRETLATYRFTVNGPLGRPE